MKKKMLICFILIAILSISFVSAAWYSPFTNFWNKITGKVISEPYCKKLYDKTLNILNNYGSQNCTTNHYDKISDINKDKWIVPLDVMLILNNQNNETWCNEKLFDNTNPCQEQQQTCNDGTAYNSCSINKPFYCNNGNLIENCDLCGCPLGQTCNVTSNNCYIPPANIIKCQYLYDSIVAFLNKVGSVSCNSSSYNKIYDINKDAWIAPNDAMLVRNNINNESWCNEKLNDLTNPCQQQLVCSDGTSYGTCSSNLPFYCDSGNLTENCSYCGCPSGQNCKNDGDCEEQEAQKVLFIVDSIISPQISNEMSLFKNQLEEDNNWEITLKEFSPDADEKDIKSFITNFYNNNGLLGVFLIGNIPTGEFFDSWSEAIIISNNYYADIYDDCREINKIVEWKCYDLQKNMNFTSSHPCEQDGMVTIEEINKTLFDPAFPCQNELELRPFFISRITPNPKEGDKAELIKQFILQDINFRTGVKTFQHKALVYIPASSEIHDAAYRENEGRAVFNYLTGNIWPNKTAKLEGAFDESEINLLNPEAENSDDEFLQEAKQDYEYLFYNGHGGSTFMQKSLTSEKVANTSTLIGDFTSCSVGRFYDKDYIVGEFLFKGDMLFGYAAAAILNKKASAPAMAFRTYLLSRGIPIFESFSAISQSGVGLNNLGDATIRTKTKASSYLPTDPKIDVPNSINFGETENNSSEVLTIFNITNLGNSNLTIYNINLFYIRKDKEHILTFSYSNTGVPINIYPQEGKEIEIGIAPTATNLGIYSGKIYIISNDPVYPIKEIPFSIQIIDELQEATSQTNLKSVNGIFVKIANFFKRIFGY